MVQVFKRHSAAVKAANGGPYLSVGSFRNRVYIVGIDASDEVQLISPPNEKGQAVIAGQISLGHLDRLGNGNQAAAASYVARDDWHAFPFERRRGFLHRFQDPADAAAFEAAKAAHDAQPKCQSCGAGLDEIEQRIGVLSCVQCGVDAADAIEAGEY